MNFYTFTINSKEWPIQVVYHEDWLDANSYKRLSNFLSWLKEQNIVFEQEQYGKLFRFNFKNKEDSVLFVMRWS